ncbi:MAG: LysR family transcriptional regulator [Lachnospiraceae bacterium]|nr:LysR family transcriptional regulator [Lachnospiraceae bacterium]
MAVNYEYYRIFYYVAKYRNLTRAAEALFSSQPNVSRVMGHLERELGCRLLNRTNKGIVLTAEGEQLYRHVAVAFEQIRLGEEELAGNAKLQGGSILVGTSETALHLYLLDRLGDFHERYPDVRLKIYNYSVLQALPALKNGQVDFAVITTPVEKHPEFSEVRLKTFSDILAGGPAFSEFAKKARSLRELDDYSLICLEKNTNTYLFYDRFYQSHGLELSPDIEVGTADLILPMIARGLGIGFLPREFAGEAIARGQIVEIPLRETIPRRSVCLVYDPKRAFGAAAGKLKELLCEDARRFRESE